MVKREVKFFVRVFPTVERDMVNFKIENNRQTMHVRAPQDIDRYDPKFIYWEFQTDGIFCNSSQKDVYNQTVQDAVRRALNGEDFIVLAYGPSCTGKTYTMTGLRSNFEQRGIAPRILFNLFKLVDELAEVCNVKVYLSFLEFIDNEIRDLLSKKPNSVTKRRSPLKVNCRTANEALRLVFEGEFKKKFEQDHVSCSTTVITIFLDITWLSKPYAHFLSKIQLVDTAGVESISSKVRSDSCQISSNMAMCWIDYVIANASQVHPDDERPIVVRASQLTEYIGPALIKGNVRLLCHVRLAKKDLLATLSAMKFGSEVKKLPLPELVYAKKPSTVLLIQSLQEENDSLKKQILLNELLKGEAGQTVLSQEELNHVSRVAEEYLQGRISSPNILSITDISILLPVLRHIYTRDLEEIKKEVERLEAHSPSKKSTLTTPAGLTAKRSKRGLASMSRLRSGFAASKSRQTLSTRKSQILAPKLSRTNKSLTGTVSTLSILDTDDITRNNAWEEFFRRYPELDKRLRLMRFNVVKALRDKEDAGKNAMKLRCRLDDARLKLEDAQWRRKATLGDTVGPDGHEIKSEAEKEAALEVMNINKEFLQARHQAAHTHSKYMDIMTMYNDLNETARLEFQEYMNKIYTTTLVLPDVEAEILEIDRQTGKTESRWSMSPQIKDEEDSHDGQRIYFENLQMSLHI
ncbi:kinesin-like protein KIF9 isoform X2 [Rhodnius prolixus]